MKRFLVCIVAVLCWATLQAAPYSVSGTVRDTEGQLLKGVKVTDGYSIVRSDEQGAYTLDIHPDAKFVYITIPSGYEVPERNGAPLFYRELDDSPQIVDFELSATGKDETRHNFFVWADVQVYNESELDYVSQAAADAAAYATESGLPSFGVSCGDIGGEWSSGLMARVHQTCAKAGFPFFALMGNHDLRTDAATNEAAKAFYQKTFGPSWYSFDKGRIHYVVLDDVFFFVRHYLGYYTEHQLNWLKADLEDLPQGSTVVIFQHIPTYSPAARRGDWKSEEYNKIVVNRQALYEILKPYNAHICSAHEHYAENFEISDNLFEHVHAPLSGLFWNSLLSCDGIPWGYYIYQADGDSLSWCYKAVGRSTDEQFSAYRTGEDPMKADCVVANVWNYDPQWKVEWSENGQPMGEMTRYAGWDRNIVSDVENRREKEFAWKNVGAGKTEHLFYAQPQSGDSHIEICVTDRFGRRYIWDSDKTVYSSKNFSITSSDVEWKGSRFEAPELASNPAYGTVKGANRLETAVYDLAVAEMVKNIEEDGTFRTGEKWSGVWTRDISYSAILSLAHLEPEVVKTSLMKKVDRKGRIIQDTGTGGAWPCSTDREVWAIAAWEVFLETGDYAWLRQVYPIIRRSLEDDLETAYNPESGLFRGESSFIDWRQQSYPQWMQPVDIAQSECLGTNAVFYRAFDVMAHMAKMLGSSKKSDERKFSQRAASLKQAINDKFWLEEEGYYAQYRYGRNAKVLSPRAETLGESLCILWGIASADQAREILGNVPVYEYGPVIFTPQISSQQSYHNNAIWPFVTSFWGKAAAQTGNRTALMHAIASNERAAAAFGSHMENLVASDGTTETLLDSPRQLWSIAGHIGLFREALLGIHYDTDGIHFQPCVPAQMKGLRSISGLKYRKMTLNVKVYGEGSIIRTFLLDGKESDPFVSASLEGEHDVEIRMCSDYYAEEDAVRLLPVLWDLDCPLVRYEEGYLKWNSVKDADSYEILCDGKPVEEITDTLYLVKGSGEYSVIARNEGSDYSFMSEPLRVRLEEYTHPLEAALSTKLGSQAKLEIEVPKSGVWYIDFDYANGNGSITTHNKCATRTLYVDRKKIGTVVLPQRGDDWNDRGWTNAVELELSAGKHSFELRLIDENINMNIDVDSALIHSIRLTYKQQ